jgi:hypothetical protein
MVYHERRLDALLIEDVFYAHSRPSDYQRGHFSILDNTWAPSLVGQ